MGAVIYYNVQTYMDMLYLMPKKKESSCTEQTSGMVLQTSWKDVEVRALALMVFHCVFFFLSRYDFTAFVSVFVIIMLKMEWLPIRCFPYSVTWGSTYVSVSINSDNISKTTGWCAAAPRDRASTVLYRWLYTLTVLPLSIMAMNSLNQQLISNLDSSLHRNSCQIFSSFFA